MSNEFMVPGWKAEQSPVAGWIVTDGNGNNWADSSGVTGAFLSQERAEGFASALNHEFATTARLRAEVEGLRNALDKIASTRLNDHSSIDEAYDHVHSIANEALFDHSDAAMGEGK